MSALDPDVGENLTKELNATLHARRDLGPEYESELIDSFLDKIGRRIDGQVERRVRREIAEQQMTDARAGFRGRPHRERHGGGWRDMRLAVVSLVLAIPLSFVDPRSGRSANLMMALLIYVIYNNLLSIMQAWLAQGKISPMVGLWPVHAFFLVLTIYMFYRRLFLLPMIPRLWFR